MLATKKVNKASLVIPVKTCRWLLTKEFKNWKMIWKGLPLQMLILPIEMPIKLVTRSIFREVLNRLPTHWQAETSDAKSWGRLIRPNRSCWNLAVALQCWAHLIQNTSLRLREPGSRISTWLKYNIVGAGLEKTLGVLLWWDNLHWE